MTQVPFYLGNVFHMCLLFQLFFFSKAGENGATGTQKTIVPGKRTLLIGYMDIERGTQQLQNS